MSNKKQTAVEFLEKQYYDNDYNIFQEDFEQAKEMEKEQIKDAYILGMEFIAVDPNYYENDAEQYYKETYEK